LQAKVQFFGAALFRVLQQSFSRINDWLMLQFDHVELNLAWELKVLKNERIYPVFTLQTI